MELINEKPLTAKKGIIHPSCKTAILSSPGNFEFEDFEFRKLEDDEIFVEMEGCGICASSIPVWQGRPWFNYPLAGGAPGHEGWGTVVEAGREVKGFKPGQRVSILTNDAFSTHVICNASKAVVIPASLEGQPLPGEPLGCAMNIYQRSDIKEGQTVVILGVGFLGAVLIQLLQRDGVNVIAVSRRESSLALAKGCGADATFNWDEKEQLQEYLSKAAPGGSERVIECVGNQQALDLATELVSERGKIIIAGYHQEDLRHINMQIWNWKGIDVINAHERDEAVYKKGIEKAIEAIEEGRIDHKRLLTHEFSFDQLNEAMETLTEYPENFTKAYINYCK